MAVCQRDCSNVRWLKREINFFLILLLGMSHGFVILTLKKNDWTCNTGTLHLLARENSKQCRLPARFIWLFFGTHKRVYMTEFLEAGNIVNSARYIETIKKLRRRVCRVRGSTSRILLLHDNARPHTAPATIEVLETLSLRFSPICPTALTWRQAISISFLTSRGISRGLISPHDDEVKQAVTSWIKQRTPEFFIDGMRKLVLLWEKCIERQGDYVEK